MDFRSILIVSAALLLCPDIHDLTRFRTSLLDSPEPGYLTALGSPAEVFISVGGQAPSQSGHLQEQSRLAIIRYVDGEFARAVEPLPGGKKGIKIQAGKPVDKEYLSNQVRFYGTSANPGDTVQITKIEFKSKEIIFQINGGGKKKFHLRDHLQVGFGVPMDQAPVQTDPNEGRGASIILDFGREVPDLSPDDVKRDLSVLLDFSRQHSAAVNWTDTLPPQFKQAIQDHHALVGMDDEMVIAALGRPDRKVRERDPNTGEETEDWIYGSPPAKTIFVTFAMSRNKVIKVEEFN
jgi:hypothetical protein